MILLLLCYVQLVLLDNEEEYPLLHIQDGRSDSPYPKQGTPYYLCYRYPRPNYWVEKFREWLRGEADVLEPRRSR